jgi:DNA-binding MarR family transcriptional regulator
MADERADRRMIGALLRIPREWTTTRVLSALAEAGYPEVRAAHFTVFQHLPPEGMRLTTLAESALLTKQTMGYLVDDLEALGYVARVADPIDRRAKLVRLTERGRSVEQVVRDVIARMEAHWAARMAPGEFAELNRLLRALIALMEEDERDAH